MDMRENEHLAARLREAADRLGGYRAAAYRRAAAAVQASPRPVRAIYQRYGLTGLEELPGVGPGIGGAIAEMLTTGRWKYLERLATERTISYLDERGVERQCLVLDPHPASRLHGRDAIAALLASK